MNESVRRRFWQVPAAPERDRARPPDSAVTGQRIVAGGTSELAGTPAARRQHRRTFPLRSVKNFDRESEQLLASGCTPDRNSQELTACCLRAARVWTQRSAVTVGCSSGM